MSDAFREPTPEEIRLATLQFMGQNLGDLKQLDSHIVNKNSTLQGLNLKAEEIIRNLPQGQSRALPQHYSAIPQHNSVGAPAPNIRTQPQVMVAPRVVSDDSGKIVDSLNKIAATLEKIEQLSKDALFYLKKEPN